MKTVETKVYQFNELSEEAKDVALDNNRDFNTSDEYWYENVIEDAIEIGDLFGIDIDKIYFSGFCHQGQGAQFVGNYAYKKGGLKAVKEYAPLDTELHSIVKALQDIQRRYFYRLSATVETNGSYSHEMATAIEVEDSQGGYHGYASDEAEEEVKDLLREYMQWIYSRLDAENDYQTSDDAIGESLQANDMEFTVDGLDY
tara:strand:+ start:754 stop:1353 length:600 start_codon:yes stop_codon:yes gene_type:complete